MAGRGRCVAEGSTGLGAGRPHPCTRIYKSNHALLPSFTHSLYSPFFPCLFLIPFNYVGTQKIWCGRAPTDITLFRCGRAPTVLDSCCRAHSCQGSRRYPGCRCQEEGGDRCGYVLRLFSNTVNIRLAAVRERQALLRAAEEETDPDAAALGAGLVGIGMSFACCSYRPY